MPIMRKSFLEESPMDSSKRGRGRKKEREKETQREREGEKIKR